MQRAVVSQESKNFPVPLVLNSSFLRSSTAKQFTPTSTTNSTSKQQYQQNSADGGLSPVKLPKPSNISILPHTEKKSMPLSPLIKSTGKVKLSTQENIPPHNKGSSLAKTEPRNRDSVIPTRHIDPIQFDQVQKTLKEKEIQLVKVTARVSEYESSMSLMKEELQKKNQTIAQLKDNIKDETQKRASAALESSTKIQSLNNQILNDLKTMETLRVENLLLKEQLKQNQDLVKVTEKSKEAMSAEHAQEIQGKDHAMRSLKKQSESLAVELKQAKEVIHTQNTAKEEMQKQLFYSVALCIKLSYDNCRFNIACLWDEASEQQISYSEYAEWIADRVSHLYAEQHFT